MEVGSQNGSSTGDKQRSLLSYSLMNLAAKLKPSNKCYCAALNSDRGENDNFVFHFNPYQFHCHHFSFPNETQMPFIQHKSITSG